MKEMTARILLGLIAVPLLLGVLLFPLPYNAALNAVILFFLAVGSWEAGQLFKAKQIRLNPLAAFFCATLPSILTLGWFFFPFYTTTMVISGLSLLFIPILVGVEAFSRQEEDWNGSLLRIAGYGFILIYLGVLGATLIGLQALSHFLPSHQVGLIYIVYLLLIFINDTMAYFVGKAVGRFTPKPAPISPKKSLAGFIGGGFFTIVASVGGFFLFPELFKGQWMWALVVGFTLGVVGIIGDLVESAFKRAAGVKDSGKLMMGRGGVLDSLDSVLFAAPFFVVILLGIHWL